MTNFNHIYYIIMHILYNFDSEISFPMEPPQSSEFKPDTFKVITSLIKIRLKQSKSHMSRHS